MDEPKAEKDDKFSMVIRQRRSWTAQERVRTLPGFVGLEHRWCDWPGSALLDQRRDDLGTGSSTRRWPTAELLVAALRLAGTEVPAGTGFALLSDEPEARWVEAALSDLLQAAATVLGVLAHGIVIFAADDRALVLEVTSGPDGDASYETTLHGEWPAALSP